MVKWTALKTNPGTGVNAGLLKSWATLKLGCSALSGRCCYWRSHDSKEKSEHFNCLIIIFFFFVYPRSTYLLVSLVDFLVLPSYLVSVYLVSPLLCLPPCTSIWGEYPTVTVLTATHGFHHLIHKTDQGVHKGTNMNERYSRLGWSLKAIYFCPFAPPQSRENILSAVHFTVKFCGGA